MDALAVPAKAFPKGLDAISKCFGLSQALTGIKGPLALRRALGVSQPAIARLLADYLVGHIYAASTIATWERGERHVSIPARYVMTAKTRTAYYQLLADVIELAGGGRLRLRFSMGPRAWHFGLETECAECGKPFRMRRSNAARCRRCVRASKR